MRQALLLVATVIVMLTCVAHAVDTKGCVDRMIEKLVDKLNGEVFKAGYAKAYGQPGKSYLVSRARHQIGNNNFQAGFPVRCSSLCVLSHVAALHSQLSAPFPFSRSLLISRAVADPPDIMALTVGAGIGLAALSAAYIKATEGLSQARVEKEREALRTQLNTIEQLERDVIAAVEEAEAQAAAAAKAVVQGRDIAASSAGESIEEATVETAAAAATSAALAKRAESVAQQTSQKLNIMAIKIDESAVVRAAKDKALKIARRTQLRLPQAAIARKEAEDSAAAAARAGAEASAEAKNLVEQLAAALPATGNETSI